MAAPAMDFTDFCTPEVLERELVAALEYLRPATVPPRQYAKAVARRFWDTHVRLIKGRNPRPDYEAMGEALDTLLFVLTGKQPCAPRS